MTATLWLTLLVFAANFASAWYRATHYTYTCAERPSLATIVRWDGAVGWFCGFLAVLDRMWQP